MSTAELDATVWRLRNIGEILPIRISMGLEAKDGVRLARKIARAIQLHRGIGDRIAHGTSSEARLLLLIVGQLNVFRCGKAAGDTRISLIIPCYSLFRARLLGAQFYQVLEI